MKRAICILISVCMLISLAPAALAASSGDIELAEGVWFSDDFESGVVGGDVQYSKGQQNAWNYRKGNAGADSSVEYAEEGGSKVVKFERAASAEGKGGPCLYKYIEPHLLSTKMTIELDIINPDEASFNVQIIDLNEKTQSLYSDTGKKGKHHVKIDIDFENRTYTSYVDGAEKGQGALDKTLDLLSSYTQLKFYAHLTPGQKVFIDNVSIWSNGVLLPDDKRAPSKKDDTYLVEVAKAQKNVGESDITKSKSYKNSLEYKVFTDDFSSYENDTGITVSSAPNTWNVTKGGEEKPVYIEKVKENPVLFFAIRPDVASGGPYVTKNIAISNPNAKLRINFELYNFGRAFTVSASSTANDENSVRLFSSKGEGYDSKEVSIDVDLAELSKSIDISGGVAFKFQVLSFKSSDFLYIDNVVFSSDDSSFDTDIVSQFKNYSKVKSDIAQSIRTGHPKIWFNSDFSFADFKKLIDSDEQLNKWYVKLKDATDKTKSSGVIEYPKGADRSPYLDWARTSENNIAALAFVANIEGDTSYKDVALAQMMDAFAHPDWTVGSALCVSEMSTGIALGYDWLYNMMTEDERAAVREGLIKEGASRMLSGLVDSSDIKQYTTDAGNNRGMVHAGSSIIVALALMDDCPGGAAAMIQTAATKQMPINFNSYEPAGAWFEGTGYWLLTTRYAVFSAQALKTAMKSGSSIPSELKYWDRNGFSKTSEFIIYMNTPRGGSFNFGDSDDKATTTGPHGWMAKEFSKPAFAAYQYQNFDKDDHGGYMTNRIFKMLIYDKDMVDAKNFEGFALAKWFESDPQNSNSTECITMRSSWLTPNASFMGVMGGQNGLSHGDWGMGNFCVESDGVRWIRLNESRLSYDYPGDHSEYYTSRPEGKNTIVFNPDSSIGQERDGKGKCIRMETNEAGSLGVIDLSDAYKQYVNSYKRGIRIDNESGNMLVSDEVSGKEAFSSGYSFYHIHSGVEARLSDDAKTAYLTETASGKKLVCKITEPSFESAKFAVVPALPLPTSPNPTFDDDIDYGKKLAIDISGQKDFSLSVEFIPVEQSEEDAQCVFSPQAVSEWTLPEASDEFKNSLTLKIGSKKVGIWGMMSENDVAPIIRNDRTMLPARFVAENLGATISWDAGERKVTITTEGKEITLFIDSDTAYVNGEEIKLDSPAFIENDRTYTPVRFISENLGANVGWNAEQRKVTISKK